MKQRSMFWHVSVACGDVVRYIWERQILDANFAFQLIATEKNANCHWKTKINKMNITENKSLV